MIAIVFIGLSVFIAESVIGKISQTNAVTAFETLAPKNKGLWKYAGFMVLSGLIILSFYSVVLGWIINYIFVSISGLPSNVDEAGKAFTKLISEDILKQLVLHTFVALSVGFIVIKGIKDGIEKLNLILMPLLAAIMAMLLAYAISLDSFGKAVDFMFVADWSKINSDAILAALGQAFFTLSIGVGTILTYSASLPKDANIVKSSIMVTIVDTSIALVAGLIIFSFLFEAGAQSSAGPGLVFISLPLIFADWGILGQVIAIAFFIALAFAGITSAVSMIEPILLYFIERLNFSRNQATILCSLIFYVGGIIALLSMSSSYGASFTFFGKNAFDWMDFLTSSIMLPLGGILSCILLGYAVNKTLIKKEFIQYSSELFFNVWYFLVKYVVPLAILVLMHPFYWHIF